MSFPLIQVDTLKAAVDYIGHLRDLLQCDQFPEDSRPQFNPSRNLHHHQQQQQLSPTTNDFSSNDTDSNDAVLDDITKAWCRLNDLQPPQLDFHQHRLDPLSLTALLFQQEFLTSPSVMDSADSACAAMSPCGSSVSRGSAGYDSSYTGGGGDSMRESQGMDGTVGAGLTTNFMQRDGGLLLHVLPPSSWLS